MWSSKRRWRTGLAALAVAAGIIPVTAGSVGAALPLPISCTAAGTVFQGDVGGIDTWTVAGKGSCQGDFEGTYFLDFSGAGTSSSRGLCDASVAVIDLKINVLGTLTNAATGAIKKFNHDWVAPLTTYPFVTPFAIEKDSDGSVVGAGAFFNHIFLQCDGSPVAQFDLVFRL